MRSLLVHVSKLVLAAFFVGGCVGGSEPEARVSIEVSMPNGEVVQMPGDAPYVWCGDFSEGSVEIQKPAVHVYLWPRLDPERTGNPNGWIIRAVVSDIGVGESIQFPTQLTEAGSEGGVDEPAGADVYVLAIPDEFSSQAGSSSGSITFDSVPCIEGEGLVEFSVDAVLGAEDGGDSSVLLQGSFSGSGNEPPQRDIYRQDCLLAGGCSGSYTLEYEGPPVGPEASVIRPDVDCGSPGFYEALRTDSETVVVSGAWADQCDASHAVKLTIVGSGTEASSAEVEYESTVNGIPQTSAGEPREVRIDQFSLDGVVSGSWGGRQFWAMVDRPTLVELDNSRSVRLELGQAAWTGPPYCLVHNDGSVDDSGAPIVTFYRDCSDDTVRQFGFDGTAVLLSTEGG